MTMTLAPYALGTALIGEAVRRATRRLQLSRAKHPSLTGHARMARRLAALVPFYEYDEASFFCSDGAPTDVMERRRAGFMRLAELYQARFANSAKASKELAPSLSDLQFTNAYRVPFQYSRFVQRHLPAGNFAEASSGVLVRDLDGNELFDLTGSYGVNVFGYDFYKQCLRRGGERASALGPVLGPYHPVIGDNVARLRKISGLDEVSFHMSGTEAVMQAVRLARYHTGRTHIVRFAGAYHGWWGDVQPGVGNPVPARETYTLEEMSEAALRVLCTRRDIACVLVNPLQALHPNAGAPSDSALVDSSRRAHFDKRAYGSWLERLRKVCSEHAIPLIFDEVFSGFRLAAGGAQEYFGIRADLVTYGKTLGGGLPVGVLCGRAALMKRYRDERPTDICFARGTFNSHPYVMTAMNEFLGALEQPELQALYKDLDGTWNRRAAALNARLQREALPLRIENMSSIWTVLYTAPARYNWLLQYYLRAEGVGLSWTGTGRLIFSLNFRDEDCDEVNERFVRAARAMHDDGFWWAPAGQTNKSIKRRVLREVLAHRFAR